MLRSFLEFARIADTKSGALSTGCYCLVMWLFRFVASIADVNKKQHDLIISPGMFSLLYNYFYLFFCLFVIIFSSGTLESLDLIVFATRRQIFIEVPR